MPHLFSTLLNNSKKLKCNGAFYGACLVTKPKKALILRFIVKITHILYF